MSSIIDTRDLITRRDEIKEQIFEDFIECFEHYEDITDSFEDIRLEEEEIQDWRDGWADELEEIDEIDTIENEVGSEFQSGETLIVEHYWEEYVEDLIKDCGYISYISEDFPSWIEIDWKATADNVLADYSSVFYQGNEYYFRHS